MLSCGILFDCSIFCEFDDWGKVGSTVSTETPKNKVPANNVFVNALHSRCKIFLELAKLVGAAKYSHSLYSGGLVEAFY